MVERKFEAPDVGAWELETAHFARPMALLTQRAVERGMPPGFTAGADRFSLLLAGMDARFVHGFGYMRMRPFGAPPDAKGPPPKIVMQLLTRLLPSMRRRIRGSHEALLRKQWRADLEDWDRRAKPQAIDLHQAIQAVDPGGLSDADLLKHLQRTVDHVQAMVQLHHHFTITCCLPIGDLIAHVQGWTGKSAGEILQALRGSSKISCGLATAELAAFAEAIRADAAARQLLESAAPPAQVLEQLRAHAAPVGDRACAYLDIVSYRCLGYDVSSRYALELPEVLIRSLRAAVAGDRLDAPDDTAKARIEGLRSAIAREHHDLFDELVGEARHINRLRDERGHYSDGWGTGLARRAALEVGRRLVERGRVDDPDQAVDATVEELGRMLTGSGGPAREEIAERSHWRRTKSVSDPDVPPWLGAPPSAPPPVDWLPEIGRRPMRAIGTFLDAMWKEGTLAATGTTVKGLPVSPGVYEGTARIVTDEAHFGRIQKGDVLITRATSPYFNVVLPLLGAIVTDRGGQLCHAAIVSREFGIPGVVGTREATTLVKDGARVRVDGDTGEVSVLG